MVNRTVSDKSLTKMGQTKSLNSLTLEEIDATILEKDGCVFLEKDNCSEKRCLLEIDSDFYKKINPPFKKIKPGFNKVVIDLTTKCNLNCSVCFRKLNSDPDLSLNSLRNISAQFKRKIILLSGGEPTLREDLPEIIRIFNKHNTVFLMTNGIKLSSLEYLKTLKRNGLNYVVFSLNALSEDTLSQINGPGILKDKLQALKNLNLLKIKTVLSAVLIKGINEKEIKPLFNFCLNNRNIISELRIRAMQPLGRFLKSEKIFLSEMVDIVSSELSLNRLDLLKELELKNLADGIFQNEIFPIKSCTLDFHLKIKDHKNIYPLAKNFQLKNSNSYPLFIKKIIILTKLIKVYGITMSCLGALKLIFKIESIPWIHPKDIFKIGLRYWPNINTINLSENRRCRTGYWFNGQTISCCRANIIKDRLNPKTVYNKSCA